MNDTKKEIEELREIEEQLNQLEQGSIWILRQIRAKIERLENSIPEKIK